MKSIKIDKVEIYATKLYCLNHLYISVGAITHARNTVVKVYLTDGTYGIGECCPYRSIHGET